MNNAALRSDDFYEPKEDRLRDIAASVLQHLSEEEEGLEFCMGIALQDHVSSDQEWFDIARDSLEEMKAYREFDRTRKQQQQQQQQQQLLQVQQQPSPHNFVDDANTIDRLRRRSNNNNKKIEMNSDDTLFNAIDAIPNIDYQDAHGDTALIIACGSRRNEERGGGAGAGANTNVIEAIIAKGANLNLRNKEGISALMYAAMNGDDAVCKRLCGLG